MKSNLIAALCLALSGVTLRAQTEGSTSEPVNPPNWERKLEGKVERRMGRALDDPQVSPREKDLSAIVKDPETAHRIAEGMTRVLSDAEMEDLHARKIEQMQSRFGRSLDAALRAKAEDLGAREPSVLKRSAAPEPEKRKDWTDEILVGSALVLLLVYSRIRAAGK